MGVGVSKGGDGRNWAPDKTGGDYGGGGGGGGDEGSCGDGYYGEGNDKKDILVKCKRYADARLEEEGFFPHGAAANFYAGVIAQRADYMKELQETGVWPAPNSTPTKRKDAPAASDAAAAAAAAAGAPPQHQPLGFYQGAPPQFGGYPTYAGYPSQYPYGAGPPQQWAPSQQWAPPHQGPPWAPPRQAPQQQAPPEQAPPQQPQSQQAAAAEAAPPQQPGATPPAEHFDLDATLAKIDALPFSEEMKSQLKLDAARKAFNL